MKISEENDGKQSAVDMEEPPPFMRTWNRLYVAIAVYTCVLILALYIMTITLNR